MAGLGTGSPRTHRRARLARQHHRRHRQRLRHRFRRAHRHWRCWPPISRKSGSGSSTPGSGDDHPARSRLRNADHRPRHCTDFMNSFERAPYSTHLLICGMFIGGDDGLRLLRLTMKAVGRAAGAMVEEVRRQFREIAGIMEGTGKPDYARCVAISTIGAQREMLVPSLLAIIVPVADRPDPRASPASWACWPAVLPPASCSPLFLTNCRRCLGQRQEIHRRGSPRRQRFRRPQGGRRRRHRRRSVQGYLRPQS